ncbi:helix-turn-helix transcriptional regulator [Streptomyces malaysiensis]|uniref:Helix-turn-helix domain-containing protein n=1 Tax=Streptomyces malaysiensis subsp. samsunensis TaxID=459658 RepID=A0A9X2LXY1_STRMQ|nr:helix-turn-helix domain-containing protein [Streptomyces samsunensis]MCQ8831858.1 helix-turn-helix domain-containing protein [Streptomyces samsunensis]
MPKKAPPGCLWLADAADYLGYDITTLRKWRLKKKGPASFKAGGKVAYRIAVLDAWLTEQEASDPHSNPALDPVNAPVESRLATAA